MAHLSGDEGLIEAFTIGEDLHRFVGARIFGVDPGGGDHRSCARRSRRCRYGLAYGLSAFGLSKQLRIESAEAKQLMSDYFARFGAVRDYLRGVVVQAKEDGYTETIFGRRRPFADLNSPNRVLRENAERAALNAPIQGTAADIMKIAMIGIDADMRERSMASRMLLQVHDELVFEVAAGERETLEEIVRSRMGGAAELRVPLDVQVGRRRGTGTRRRTRLLLMSDTVAGRTPTPVDRIAEEWVQTLSALSPELATYIGGTEKLDEYSDYSPAGRAELLSAQKRTLAQLDAADPVDDDRPRDDHRPLRRAAARRRARGGRLGGARHQRARLARAGHP